MTKYEKHVPGQVITIAGKEYSLDEPFFISERNGDDLIAHSNAPNDSLGDHAFEWDLDGSQRAKWDEYVKELEEAGVRGDLVYITIHMRYNPIFDAPALFSSKPLESYKLMYLIP